jgi:hypothetical protein
MKYGRNMNDRIQELETTLDDLYEGRRVIVPHDLDHAYQMLMIASAYIRDDQQRMITYLKKDTFIGSK